MKLPVSVIALLALLAASAAAQVSPEEETVPVSPAEDVGGLFGLFRRDPPVDSGDPGGEQTGAGASGAEAIDAGHEASPSEATVPEPLSPAAAVDEDEPSETDEERGGAVREEEVIRPELEEFPSETTVTEPPLPRQEERGDEDAGAVSSGADGSGEAVIFPGDRSSIRPGAEERGSRNQDLESDLEASRRPADEMPADDVRLPPEEIRGELEKPDIFFLLPKARNQSDEQLIRARIRREITRPLIKEWLEEELLLK